MSHEQSAFFQGDSGGPVVCQKYGKAFAQGIYSGPTDRCRRILHQNCSFI
uniref:Peptidase S1 domain-containing protein n=1 Tax=Romanomermis culicivorax TaxID=13658 RepID=A0A915HRY4_ROMCU